MAAASTTDDNIVTLRIKFKSENLDRFIDRYAVDVSPGGIFIRTREPLAVGTAMAFDFTLNDGTALLSGSGTVVWIRETDPTRTASPGMGVRFDKLAPSSQAMLSKILAEKARRDKGEGAATPGVGRMTAPVIETVRDGRLGSQTQRSRSTPATGAASRAYSPVSNSLADSRPNSNETDSTADDTWQSEKTEIAALPPSFYFEKADESSRGNQGATAVAPVPRASRNENTQDLSMSDLVTDDDETNPRAPTPPPMAARSAQRSAPAPVARAPVPSRRTSSSLPALGPAAPRGQTPPHGVPGGLGRMPTPAPLPALTPPPTPMAAARMTMMGMPSPLGIPGAGPGGLPGSSSPFPRGPGYGGPTPPPQPGYPGVSPPGYAGGPARLPTPFPVPAVGQIPGGAGQAGPYRSMTPYQTPAGPMGGGFDPNYPQQQGAGTPQDGFRQPPAPARPAKSKSMLVVGILTGVVVAGAAVLFAPQLLDRESSSEPVVIPLAPPPKLPVAAVSLEPAVAPEPAATAPAPSIEPIAPPAPAQPPPAPTAEAAPALAEAPARSSKNSRVQKGAKGRKSRGKNNEPDAPTVAVPAPPSQAAAPAAAAPSEDAVYWLTVRSTPPRAEVMIDGEVEGKTPFERRILDPSRSYAVVVKLDGYEAFDQSLSSGADWVAKGNERRLTMTAKLKKAAGGVAAEPVSPKGADKEPAAKEPAAAAKKDNPFAE